MQGDGIAILVSEQKWIVAVIFMVPVYSTESAEVFYIFSEILSLWNAKLSLACDILRNCYEALALYAFGSYLIACLGGEREVIRFLEDEAEKQINKPLLEEEKEPESQQKTFRNFIFRPSVLGEDLFTIIKFGLVQYMILKTLCAFLALVLELCGVYGDGEFKWYYGYPYITLVLNFSQMWALYCLVQFYNVTHRRLEPIKPLAKFISFKAIVFATWWQDGNCSCCSHFRLLSKTLSLCTDIPCYHQETTAMLNIEEGGKEKPTLFEKRETEVEAPGTNIKESVQDIVVEGGQKVVKDVVLTINQAIEPVHEGMTKIQETFHQMSVSGDNKDEPEMKIEEHEESVTRETEV
ncbi:hypothetical protein DH2020_014660 [Rehmannia glutinosa]|uniref:Uncharacterized protein n=1 Tax=Rehmannia glutinosa TaxID=99300 RepID=A0ABR0X101_REHGL